MLILKVGTSKEKREKYNQNKKYNFDYILNNQEIVNILQYTSDDIWGDKKYYLLNDWNSEEIRNVLYKSIEDIKNSNNIFVIDEAEMLDATLEKIKKYSSEFYDFREVNMEEKFNSFNLIDYIYKRDKKNAWLYFNKHRDTFVLEEFLGALMYKSNVVNDKNKNYQALRIWSESHENEVSGIDEVEKLILAI